MEEQIARQDALDYIADFMLINPTVELHVTQTTPFGPITLSIGDHPCAVNGNLLTFPTWSAAAAHLAGMLSSPYSMA